MEPIVRGRRVGHHNADPEHLPQAPLGRPAGVDPAVINGERLACPLQQPRVAGRHGGRGSKPEHAGVVGRQDVLRGGQQQRVACPEQRHPVLAGDVGVVGDRELLRQVKPAL